MLHVICQRADDVSCFLGSSDDNGGTGDLTSAVVDSEKAKVQRLEAEKAKLEEEKAKLQQDFRNERIAFHLLDGEKDKLRTELSSALARSALDRTQVELKWMSTQERALNLSSHQSSPLSEDSFERLRKIVEQPLLQFNLQSFVSAWCPPPSAIFGTQVTPFGIKSGPDVPEATVAT